jgi:hypothetical protein
MRCSSLCVLAFAAIVLADVGGCQTVGPKSIGQGRDRYNSIIQSTSMEQTMSNIVRVYNHEPTLFMDITEVDAAVSFGGSLNGAATGIGSRAGTSGGTLAAQVGNVGAAVQYSESPTIRYQPLLGQPLVAQMVTPVSVDALGLLYDSYWDIAPLLDFSAAYLTLDYREFYIALDTINELGSRGALELVAGKSDLLTATTSEPDKPSQSKPGADAPDKTGDSKKSGGSNNDSLIIYLRPYHRNDTDIGDKQRVLQLWIRMLRLYGENQPPFIPPNGCAIDWRSQADLTKWDQGIGNKVTGSDADKSSAIDNVRKCLPDKIELRVIPVPASTGRARTGTAVSPERTSDAPLMRTYSALGIVKNATERPGPKIEFVTPQVYRQIRDNPWNADINKSSYYTLLPSEQDSIDCPELQKQKGGCDNPLASDQNKQLAAEIDRWIQGSVAKAPPAASTNAAKTLEDNYTSGLDVYETPGKDILSSDYVNFNGLLGQLRRYILVVVDDHLPQEPVYVSYTDGQRWYYIAKEDAVSQRNFQLVTLFMTMMAVPPSTQPLSPVINVGG